MIYREKRVVDEINGDTRLYDYCVGCFERITSRKGIKKAIQKGYIYLNGRRGHSGDWIKKGDEIELKMEESIPTKPDFFIPLKIHYEDEHLAVISKPAGWICSGYHKRTIEALLPHNLQPSRQADRLNQPQCVHRLDRPTSGLLLIGKTTKATRLLNAEFAKGNVQKYYEAVVQGSTPEWALVQLNIGSKPCKTTFALKKTWLENGHTYSWLRVQLHSGRKHQIRQHLKCIGHPIMGEQITDRWRRLLLHAGEIEFRHPETEEKMTFKDPLPFSFSKSIPVSE